MVTWQASGGTALIIDAGELGTFTATFTAAPIAVYPNYHPNYYPNDNPNPDHGGSGGGSGGGSSGGSNADSGSSAPRSPANDAPSSSAPALEFAISHIPLAIHISLRPRPPAPADLAEAFHLVRRRRESWIGEIAAAAIT